MRDTLGTRGFSRVRREFSVLAEATQKPETAREKCLAPKVNAGKVSRRSNNVSKQSHSAIRHDTDDCEVAWGNWVQIRLAKR